MRSHMTWHVNRCSCRHHLTIFRLVLCSVLRTHHTASKQSHIYAGRYVTEDEQKWSDGGMKRREGEKVHEEVVIGRKEKQSRGGVRDQSVKGCAPRPGRAKLYLLLWQLPACTLPTNGLSTSTPSGPLACLFDFLKLCAFKCKPALSKLRTEVGCFPLEQPRRELMWQILRCWIDLSSLATWRPLSTELQLQRNAAHDCCHSVWRHGVQSAKSKITKQIALKQ